MNSLRNPIRILPLGGFGEIGMNCLVIETNDEIIIVDCGVIFPSEPRLGVDIIHASFDYLVENRNKIVGLIATHGHEDHIAAIPFLLERITIPVFAGTYTNGLIRVRLNEFPQIEITQLVNIFDQTPFCLGQFQITPIRMPHSTVDNFALLIVREECTEHEAVRIFHTSDFKLNVENKKEKQALLSSLQSLRPIDLMITDSTGSMESEDAGDEDTLFEHIGELISNAEGRVFVALFSSNIERIGNLVKIAEQTDRKIVLSGRSVISHYQVARETGDIPSSNAVVIPQQNAHHLNDKKLLILLSGTQGENRSALGRFASSRHSHFSPKPSDTVVLSSRFIPGNELQISRTISRLIEQGVTVFHRHNRNQIHVSGHGSRNEILSAMQAIAPAALLPAHGTIEHLMATADLARTANIEDTIVAVNGDMILFAEKKLSLGEKISAKKVFVENGRPIHENILKERNKLANFGIYVIWLIISRDSLSTAVRVYQHCSGVIQENEHTQLYESIEKLVRKTFSEKKLIEKKDDAIQQEIKRLVRRHIRNEYARNPLFEIRIQRA